MHQIKILFEIYSLPFLRLFNINSNKGSCKATYKAPTKNCLLELVLVEKITRTDSSNINPNLGVGAQWDLVSVVIGAKALQQKWNEAQLNSGASENTIVEPSTTTYTAYIEKPVNDGLTYGGAVDYINYDSALVKTKGSTAKSYIGTQSDWQYTAYTVFKNKGYNLSPSIAMVLKNDGALDDKSYFKLGFGAQIFY